MTKRSFDIAVALTVGIVTSPLWLFAVVAITLTDGRPLLHRATRVGRGGVPFTLYKFRTMQPGDGPALTVAGDPRVTRIGATLRRTKIDELPQLWNVLRGEMSIVGPRPEDPSYVERYTAEQRLVLTVVPGMTSRAAIAFRHEEQILARADDPERAYLDEVLPAKLALDLAGLEQQSRREDLRVLVATVRSLVGKA
jgi:lipopolysaccharide/colanic/teichoic acid biosynthesis glycosyltransferase